MISSIRFDGTSACLAVDGPTDREVFREYVRNVLAPSLDTCEGDLTTAIVKGGSVNTQAVGSYTLTYDVTDSAGNHAVQKTP